jgi:chromate transport protein ChrA
MKFDSSGIRILIEMSLVWTLAAALLVWLLVEPGWGIPDYVARFLSFTIPVWGFWTWRWAERRGFGRVRRGSVIRTGGKWVGLTPEQAKAHSLYGVEGWALLLVAALLFNVIGVGFSFLWFLLDFIELPGQVRQYNAIIAGLNIVVAAVDLFALYQLTRKQPGFQLSFTVFVGLVLANDIVTFKIVQNLPSYLIVAGAWRAPIGIAMLLGWLVYVWRSRRINITCRHRIRRKDLQHPKGS